MSTVKKREPLYRNVCSENKMKRARNLKMLFYWYQTLQSLVKLYRKRIKKSYICSCLSDETVEFGVHSSIWNTDYSMKKCLNNLSTPFQFDTYSTSIKIISCFLGKSNISVPYKRCQNKHPEWKMGQVSIWTICSCWVSHRQTMNSRAMKLVILPRTSTTFSLKPITIKLPFVFLIRHTDHNMICLQIITCNIAV